ncbi:MAG TPA: hypothetical protein VF069_24415 [Streptosporangiaceae bacterium]
MAKTTVRRGAAIAVAGVATSSFVLLGGGAAHAQDFGGDHGHHHKKVCHYVVISKHAKIRKGPGFEFRVIGKLHRGQVIKATCRTVHGFVKLIHHKRFGDEFAPEMGDLGMGDFEHGHHGKGDLEMGDFDHGKGDHEKGHHRHHKDGWVFRHKLLKLHKRPDGPVDTGAGGTADKASPVLPAAAGLGLITLGSGIAITSRRRRSAETTPTA